MKRPIEIRLNGGLVAYVDKCDEEAVSALNWNYWLHRNTCYAISAINRTTVVAMHRFILNPPKHLMVDHINGNGLDNRRENLRLATCQQNNWNARKTSRKCASRFKGVSLMNDHPRRKKWRAQIMDPVSRKRIGIGYYRTEEEAAVAYNEAAKEKFGSFALLNSV